MKVFLKMGLMVAALGFMNLGVAAETDAQAIKRLEQEIENIRIELKRLAVSPPTGGWVCSAKCGKIQNGQVSAFSIRTSAPGLGQAWSAMEKTCAKREEGFSLIVFTTTFPSRNPQYVFANMKDSCAYDANGPGLSDGQSPNDVPAPDQQLTWPKDEDPRGGGKTSLP